MALAKRNYIKENKQPSKLSQLQAKVRLISGASENSWVLRVVLSTPPSIASKENLDLVQPINDDKDNFSMQTYELQENIYSTRKQKSVF